MDQIPSRADVSFDRDGLCQVARLVDVFPEDDIFVMHRVPFRAGITHVENMGSMEGALNTRCLIGAFPIPIEGGEASPCRVVAFIDE